jgi:ClpA/ClpB-like protein
VFERYTEEARRVIFFARYEAATLASSSIEAEHILLGLLREGRGVVGKVFQLSQLTYPAVRKEIELRVAPSEPMSTAVDIPLSAAARSVLQHAAEEADRLHAEHIGREHLLLGLLREPNSLPASVLASNLRLEDVREEVPLLARVGGVAHRVEAFENLARFLAAVEERGGRPHVLSFRGTGVRVEVSGPEQRWAVTFFVNGGVAVETFVAVGGVQDETALPGLLDALGPPRPGPGVR